MEPETIIKQALEGRYEIQQVIGRGGMATVYKAIQISLNRPVALKVVHHNLVHDEELIKRFIREAQTCASLHHPNIVTVYDVGSVGLVHYMAMEYLEGVTLRNLILDKGKLGVESSIYFIAPIAGALDYMHRKGVIHRDVKSSNIFISDDGQPVLMDFGIVYAEGGEDLSQPGAILGTPEYMSPEQAEGREKIDGRSDLYSLGVVIFECLTGHLPFHADTYMATLHQVMHNPVPRIKRVNPSVPIWLDSLADGCLEKDRNRRIQSGIELKSALLANKFIPHTTRVDEHTTRKIDLKQQNRQKNSHVTHKSPNKTRKNLILASLFAAIGILLVAIIFLLLNPSGGIVGNSHAPLSETLNMVAPDPEDREQTMHSVDTDKELEPGIGGNVQSAEEEEDKLARVLELMQQGDRYLARNIPERALEEYRKALALAPSNNQIIDKVVTATNAMKAFQKNVTDETKVASESKSIGAKPVRVPSEPNTVKDIDGNIYRTVKIGNQYWMAENLKTAKYNDGTIIPNVSNKTYWFSLTSGAYCWFNNDIFYKDTFGTLYNWYAVNTKKLCPLGWHVPTDSEWSALENYLIANGFNYDETTVGNKIGKALAATSKWASSTNTGAVGNNDYQARRNATGFSALPGGCRNDYGEFGSIVGFGGWWSASEYSTATAWSRGLYYDSNNVSRDNDGKEFGNFVRCIRN